MTLLAHCGGVLRAKAVQVGELEEALDAIKWGTDYLLNAHVEPKKFVAMYGSSEVRPGTPRWELGVPILWVLSRDAFRRTALPAHSFVAHLKAYCTAPGRRLCCLRQIKTKLRLVGCLQIHTDVAHLWATRIACPDSGAAATGSK